MARHLLASATASVKLASALLAIFCCYASSASGDSGLHNYFPLDAQLLDVNLDGQLDRADADIFASVRARLERLIKAHDIAEPQPSIGPYPPDRFIRDQQRWWLLRHLAAGGNLPAAFTPDLIHGMWRLAAFAEHMLRLRCVAEAIADQRSLHEGATAPADEIARLDLAPFVALGLRPVALSDLDDTVWAYQISHAFVDEMLSRGRVKPEARELLTSYLLGVLQTSHSQTRLRALAKLVLSDGDSSQASAQELRASIKAVFNQLDDTSRARLLRRLHLDQSHRSLPADENHSWIDGYGYFMVAAAITAGYTANELDGFAAELFKHFAEHIFLVQEHRFAKLRAKEVEIWTISAGLGFLARAGSRLLGVEPAYVLASELVFDEQGRSAGLPASNTFHYKDELLLQIVTAHEAMPVIVYGDSVLSDTPMAYLADFARGIVQPADDSGYYLLRSEIKATTDSAGATLRWLEAFNTHYASQIAWQPRPPTRAESKEQ